MSEAAERYSRLQELFEAVVDLSPEERNAVLEAKCGDDAALRQQVDALLVADAKSIPFDGQSAWVVPENLFPEEADEQLTGRRFGAYQILREIGRGGLGTVYLAARADDEYRKEVALKLIRRGLDTDDILRRFRNERQILAQLDHPNIARLLDGGTSDDGLPYFVMEYVNGEPLGAYCDSHKLNIQQRLALFRRVCAAVTYAHQNLVIHRDLKPSNILVTAEGEPKLLDFGIARVLSSEEEMFTQTAPGLRAMTPDYASPEQVKGEKITTSSDVYSLGVLLYELLTGEKPYRLTSRSAEEMGRAITHNEPERPSTVVTRNQQSSVGNPKSLRGDLDNIVLMALRKEPERRYASVADFSEDIRRHLEGLTVHARQDTFAYRAQKFVQRNKLGVAAALIVLFILTGGITQALVQAKRVVQERNHAQKEAAKASRINTFLQDILAFSDPGWRSSNPNRSREATVAEALEAASRRVESELADQPEVAAAVHFTLGWTYKAQGKLDAAEPHLRASLDLRRRALGAQDQDTAQSMVGLAELFALHGESKEGEAMTREAVTIYRAAQARGEELDTKWFSVALGNLGVLVNATKGDDATCEALYREALAVSANLTGADRAPVPTFLTNLSVIRSEQGDLDGAIIYARKALEEQRSQGGDSRVGMALSLNNLANYLMMRGSITEAEPMVREAIEISLATVGEEHPSTSMFVSTLSNHHYLSGDYSRALEEARRAVGILERNLPEEHVDFVRAWAALGNALTETGAAAEGERYLRRALDLALRKYPAGSRYIALVQGSLGRNLMVQKRYKEAAGLLQISYDELKRRLGAEHPQTVRAADRLRELDAARAE